MKKNNFLLIAPFVLIVVLVSCSPGRAYYRDRYPGSHTSVSLIISPHPGIIISQYPNGRYYYRSPEGYIYWRGFDNRYYLDRSYIKKIHYNQRQYKEWKFYDRRSPVRRRYR